MRGDADQSGARAQGCLSGQAHGTGHPLAAADNEHMPVVTLVAGARAPAERGLQQGRIDALQRGLDTLTAGVGYLEVGKAQLAAVIGRLAEEQAAFQAHEGHGQVGAHGGAEHGARIAMDTGGNIERQDRCRVCIERRNGPCKLSAHLALEAAAEHPVDQQRRLGVEFAGPGQHDPALGGKIAVGGRGIALQRCRIHE